MQISSRFTIAIHMLTCMETFKEEYKITSDFLASSINVNPVIIRRILSQLKDAGLIEVNSRALRHHTAAGEDHVSGCLPAVECIEENTLFHFHENPNPDCPVGRNIHNILDDKLIRVQEAMERELKAITLADVMDDLEKILRGGKQ